MREILFRGFHECENGKQKVFVNGAWHKGEWVEGYFIEDNESFGKPDYHAYIVNHSCPSGCFGRDIFREVIPSTVGQYTGLLDKNGQKIFEGDILRLAYRPDEDYIVEWNDGSYRFRRRIYPKEYGYESLCCVQNSVAHLKVIGKIHDNPELMEGDTE